jgi:hypothetical protein
VERVQGDESAEHGAVRVVRWVVLGGWAEVCVVPPSSFPSSTALSLLTALEEAPTAAPPAWPDCAPEPAVASPDDEREPAPH